MHLNKHCYCPCCCLSVLALTPLAVRHGKLLQPVSSRPSRD